MSSRQQLPHFKKKVFYNNFKTEITSFEEYDSPDAALDTILSPIVNPLFIYQWETARPSMKPVPDEITVATIHVRVGSLKAWMDGKVSNDITNNGDRELRGVGQNKVNFKEQKTNKKITYCKDKSKNLGNMNKDKKLNWKVSWKVEGVWSVWNAIVEFFQTGKIKTNFTCHVDAKYTVYGKMFFFFATSKESRFSKDYTVKGNISIRKFNIDVQW